MSQYVNERYYESQQTIKLSMLSITIHWMTILIISRNCLVENIGVEPMTSCVQGRRSSQLS